MALPPIGGAASSGFTLLADSPPPQTLPAAPPPPRLVVTVMPRPSPRRCPRQAPTPRSFSISSSLPDAACMWLPSPRPASASRRAAPGSSASRRLPTPSRGLLLARHGPFKRNEEASVDRPGGRRPSSPRCLTAADASLTATTAPHTHTRAAAKQNPPPAAPPTTKQTDALPPQVVVIGRRASRHSRPLRFSLSDPPRRSRRRRSFVAWSSCDDDDDARLFADDICPPSFGDVAAARHHSIRGGGSTDEERRTRPAAGCGCLRPGPTTPASIVIPLFQLFTHALLPVNASSSSPALLVCCADGQSALCVRRPSPTDVNVLPPIGLKVETNLVWAVAAGISGSRERREKGGEEAEAADFQRGGGAGDWRRRDTEETRLSKTRRPRKERRATW